MKKSKAFCVFFAFRQKRKKSKGGAESKGGKGVGARDFSGLREQNERRKRKKSEGAEGGVQPSSILVGTQSIPRRLRSQGHLRPRDRGLADRRG